MSASPSVLVVDDDVEVTRTFEQILRRQGFDVRTANSAEEGLWKATFQCADAIIACQQLTGSTSYGGCEATLAMTTRTSLSSQATA